jgi:prolyl 4-hydroxylase
VLNVTVQPKRGRAVLWPSVLDHKPSLRDDRTDHEAVHVRKGTKYGANYWLHMWEFQRPNEAGCSNQETFGNW